MMMILSLSVDISILFFFLIFGSFLFGVNEEEMVLSFGFM
jgi:nitrogen fixation-related uncharacterized protein